MKEQRKVSMSANVENMFSVREKPWHGLGTVVETAPTSAEAISLAGLDWKVIPEKLFTESGNEIPVFANVRETDKQFYGVVTGKYKIVQNSDAFQFIDNLANNGVVNYETAGSLAFGKKVFMTVKLNETKSILGDDFENYLVMTNSHDGKGSVKVAVSPIRVVCQNTLNLALNNASFSWSVRHFGNVKENMKIAQEAINHTVGYIDSLEAYAEEMEQKIISYSSFQEMYNTLFPIKEDSTDRVKRNMEEMHGLLENAYNQSDIQKFKGTAWGVINAVSDVIGHRDPQRSTSSFEERRFEKVAYGHPVLHEAQELLMSA